MYQKTYLYRSITPKLILLQRVFEEEVNNRIDTPWVRTSCVAVNFYCIVCSYYAVDFPVIPTLIMGPAGRPGNLPQELMSMMINITRYKSFLPFFCDETIFDSHGIK